MFSISIIVPSQTVRGFKSFHQKSLGIAYIEFTSEEDAELAKAEINGKFVDGRALRVKSFVEYSPGNKVIKRSRSRRGPFGKSKDDVKSVPEKIDEEEATLDTGAAEGNEQQEASDNIEGDEPALCCEEASGESEETKSQSPNVEEREVSKDTVFISRLSPKATDGDLRLFFHDYAPTDVYIFKNRFSKKQHPLRFHQRYVSALVTLTVEDGVPKAIEALSNEKVKCKPVIVRAAYVSKIEDVKKAAAARQKKNEKLEQEANAAAQAAVEKSEADNHRDSINVVQEDDEGFEGFENEKPAVQTVEA